MAESYSVKAILSAVDKSFSSTLQDALGTTNSLGDTLKSGIGFGALMSIGNKAVSAVTSGISGLFKETVSTSDSMQKLQQAMRFSGTAESEIERIAGATGTLKTYADKTVFSLDDVMSTFGALSANGVKDADKLTESVGNAVAVFGGGATEYSSIALAFSQAMAAGALKAQDWNQILNASPQLAGGLKKELEKLNPVIAKDFKGAMEDGVITSDLLAQAMNNIGMTEMAQEAATSVTTWEGAMGNLEATVSGGMQTIYDSFAKGAAIDAVNGFTDKIGGAFTWLTDNIPKAIGKISPYWDAFVSNFNEVKSAFGEAASAIIGDFTGLTGAFGSADSVSNFSDIVGTAKDALVKFAGFIKDNSETIAKFITMLPKLYIAFKGFQILSAVLPLLRGFGSAIAGLAGKGISAIAQKLFGVAAGQVATGTASASSTAQVLASAVAFIALGAGIALASAGLALLANSAIKLASAGPVAIAVMAALILVLAGLAVGAAVLGPALTAGAVGFIAFGAAITLVGVGALLAAAALAIVSAVLPQIIQYGAAGAVAIVTLSAAMFVFAGAAATTGVASVVLAAGLVAVAAGLALVGAAVIIVAVGVLALAAGVVLLSAGFAIAAVALTLTAAVLPLIASGATASTLSLSLLLAASVLLTPALILLTAGMAAVGAAALVSAVGVAAFGVAILASSVGALAMAVALKAVNSRMKTIAKNAKTADKSISNMESGISVVSNGLNALKEKASSSMDALVSAVKGAATKGKSNLNSLLSAMQSSISKAKSKGKSIGSGFASSLSTGIGNLYTLGSNAVNELIKGINANGTTVGTAATAIATSIDTAIAAADDNAYSYGTNIGQGLADGMSSVLSKVTQAATDLAAQAAKAIQAKAEIHSPSKVTTRFGEFWGGGFADGISNMVRKVKSVSEALLYIPSNISGGELLLSTAGGSLSGNYDYETSKTYTFETTVDLDGKTLAKGTATYTKAELTKLEAKESRKAGRR